MLCCVESWGVGTGVARSPGGEDMVVAAKRWEAKVEVRSAMAAAAVLCWSVVRLRGEVKVR